MLEPGILLLLLLFLLHRSPFSGHFVTDFQQTKNNRGRSLRVRAGRHGGESGPTGDPLHRRGRRETPLEFWRRESWRGRKRSSRRRRAGKRRTGRAGAEGGTAALTRRTPAAAGRGYPASKRGSAEPPAHLSLRLPGAAAPRRGAVAPGPSVPPRYRLRRRLPRH